MIEYQVITEVNKNGFGMLVDHILESRSGELIITCYKISSCIECFFLPKQVRWRIKFYSKGQGFV